MPKRATPLTVIKVRTAAPGSYSDGGGLMLVVQPSASAQWLLRFRMAGRRRDMGLGAARGRNAVSLADARQHAAKVGAIVKAGVDPLPTKNATKTPAESNKPMTFFKAATEYLDTHEAGWKNSKHRAQWRMTLMEYACPKIGSLSAANITTADVLSVVLPLWFKVPETATRLRARIEVILDFARVKEGRSGENPARWRGNLETQLVPRAQLRPVKHHAALPWEQLPEFLVDLRQRNAVAARALDFAILTAARSGEVLGARWTEVDLNASIWIVPAERMKAKREHRVPLAPAAVELLHGMLVLAEEPNGFIFPGRKDHRPQSIMALAMTLRRLGRGDLTAHGFRSCFRDWAGETTPHPREVVEQALAHRTGDKVEQAYARGDLFTKRRKLMQDWANFCGTGHRSTVTAHAEPALPSGKT